MKREIFGKKKKLYKFESYFCRWLLWLFLNKLENTKVAIKNRQSRETDNIRYTRHKMKTNKTITQHNMCWTPLYANNVNKTWALLQTTGRGVKTNRISFVCRNRRGHHNMELENLQTHIGQHKKLKRRKTDPTVF